MASSEGELFAALHEKDVMKSRRLIRDLSTRGHDFTRVDADGRTPLQHWSCLYGLEHVFADLLPVTTNVDTSDESDITPLMSASSAGHAFAVDILLQRGADPLKQDSIQKYSALHYASSKGHKDIVELLLTVNGAKQIHLLTSNQETPLHLAAARGRTSIVEILLSAGANVNARNIRGEAPGHLAADFAAQDHDARAFMVIVQAKGWDPSLKDKDGKAAFEILPVQIAEEADRLWREAKQ